MLTTAQLRLTLGETLYASAQALIDAALVSDVRVLQAGRIVTGVVRESSPDGAHARRRVYIQYPPNLDPANMQAECSCGAKSPCAHVVAVAIIGISGTASVTTPLAVRHAPRIEPSSTGQHVFYLLEPVASVAAHRDDEALKLTVWVGRVASAHDARPSELYAFAVRHSSETGFPRYVAATDAAILRELSQRAGDGPWLLRGAHASELLRQISATRRAYWQSFDHGPLREGATRAAHIEWRALPDGQQRLECHLEHTSDCATVFMSLKDPLYVDRNEWGSLALTHSLHALRPYWHAPPVPPEQVAHCNEQLDAQGSTLPRLRALPIRKRTATCLHGKLHFSAGPTTTLSFVYDGVAIDRQALDGNATRARALKDGVAPEVWEFERDMDREHALHARLSQTLPDATQSASAWLRFMIEALPALAADGWQFSYERAFPYRLARIDHWCADLDTRRSQDWFDLRLSVRVDDTTINLLPVLVEYLQGASGSSNSYRLVGTHWCVQLPDGRYLPIALERIQRIADTLVELVDGDLGEQQSLALPRSHASRVVQLKQALEQSQLASDDAALLTHIEQLERFTGIQPLNPPADFAATLRPYQREGLGWLQFLREFQLGGILADDMGLGKTVQTIAHLLMEKQQGRLQGPSLIVAPVSVIGNWQQELRTFAPTLNVLTLHGPSRKAQFHRMSRVDIVIIGYPSLHLDSDALLAQHFYYVILDEAQMIRNPRALVARTVRTLRAQHRLCLTGTPIENHLGELWALFDFATPGLLGNERYFTRHYRTPIEKHADQRRAEALTRRIAPFVLRRSKATVARELPPKTEIVESLTLDEQQRDFYDGIRLAMHQRVRETIAQQGLARSHVTMLDALLKLRQACCDPRLVRSGAPARAIPSAKMDWLETVLPELVAEGRRVLLFSQFTSMLQLIEDKIRQLSIPYCLLTGATTNRSAVVQRFQDGETPLFLISLKAGGAGLNLTAADTVIHYDPWWNPAAEAQATDRAHRIGQDQPVFVHKLIAQGTVEEKILDLQARKQALADQLYAGTSATPSQLSAADLQSLFEP